MDRSVSQLYRDFPENAGPLLVQSLESGLKTRQEERPVPVFFRADDIGAPSDSFTRMMALFNKYKVPLCLAVVPAWLTETRWASMAGLCDRDSSLWCWHQHGWKHLNHETSGKKAEFGTYRPEDRIRADVSRVKERLSDIMGPAFSPYFTPPWNRCSPATIRVLEELGFHGISRSVGNKPPSPSLPDAAINVDLHTRKERNSMSCLLGLAAEMTEGAGSGRIGMMLHHQRMNEQAFSLLDYLLDFIAHQRNLSLVTFKAL
jgi:peptidoglycan/xylan/chitin deacetylase (PgdA/CDA1 family)